MKDNERIVFLPLKEGVTGKEHFGLAPVKIKYSDKHKVLIKPEQEGSNKLSRKWYIFAFIIFIFCLLSAVLIQPKVQKQIHFSEIHKWVKSIKSNTIALFQRKEKKTPIVSTVINKDNLASAENKIIVKKDTTIIKSNNPKPFQVILASFNSKKLAEQEIERLKLKKGEVRILEFKEKGKFRLSIAEYADKEFAKQKLDSLKNVYKKNVWILSL